VITLDANGAVFNHSMAREVLRRLMRENLDIEEVAMHPEQVVAVINCYVSVTIGCVEGDEELTLDNLPPMSLMGRPIKKSPEMPPDMIRFMDSMGQELAALINLGRIK